MTVSQPPVKPRRTRTRAAAYVALVCVLYILYLFVWQGMRFFLVPSDSMEPTLLSRDYLVSFRQTEYRRGEIVVIKDPEEEGNFLVKRIVGVGGDTIEIQGGALFLNGKYASEPYMKEPMEFAFDLMTVPRGEVFVLGDNRNKSEDSVTWKRAIPLSDVVGKVYAIYNPISRMGGVRSYPLTNVDGT